MIRSTLLGLLLCTTLLSSCSPPQQKGFDGVITEEIKKELLSIETAVYESETVTTEKAVANINKYVMPQFQMTLSMGTFSRDEIIKNLLSRKVKVIKSRLHGQTYITAGDTIVVQGYTDWTNSLDGKETEFRDVYYCDIFSLVDGQWKILATIQPQSIAPVTPESKPKQ